MEQSADCFTVLLRGMIVARLAAGDRKLMNGTEYLSVQMSDLEEGRQSVA